MGAAAVGLDHGADEATDVVELLIRVQEALEVDEIVVVGVVEVGGGPQVQRRQIAVPGAGGTRAIGPPGLGEGGVYVGVVVDVTTEGGAPCLPNRVGTCSGRRNRVKMSFMDQPTYSAQPSCCDSTDSVKTILEEDLRSPYSKSY